MHGSLVKGYLSFYLSFIVHIHVNWMIGSAMLKGRGARKKTCGGKATNAWAFIMHEPTLLGDNLVEIW